MLQTQCLSLSSKFNPPQQACSFGKYAWPPLTQTQGVVNRRSPNKMASIKSTSSSQSSFYSTNQNKLTHHSTECIINVIRIHKPLHKLCAPMAASHDGCALQSDEAAPSFLDVLKKKLTAINHFTRFYVQYNNIVAVTSVCFLPLQSLSQVTPTFLMGVLKAIVPTVLMAMSVCCLNQIYDVEIDRINKPYLPLASGDLSMPTGIAICVGTALLSIVLGVMSGSPAFLWGLSLWGIAGAAYSIPLPFLRWKSHPFLAPLSMTFVMGLILQIAFFIHTQNYVLGGPFVATRPLIFATTIMSILGFVNGLLKDLPDVEGDKAFGMRTLSVILGKEKVLSLSVNLMLLGYGCAVITGAFASSMTNKLVTIISHSILALMMWRQSKQVDLDNSKSTFGFYMYLWKLNYVEYILIHFLR